MGASGCLCPTTLASLSLPLLAIRLLSTFSLLQVYCARTRVFSVHIYMKYVGETATRLFSTH